LNDAASATVIETVALLRFDYESIVAHGLMLYLLPAIPADAIDVVGY
jgi:hypothetical protein